MKYQAIRNSHGYRDRYWNKGEIVEVSDGEEKPPEHFLPITSDLEAAEKAERRKDLLDQLDTLRGEEELDGERLAQQLAGGQSKEFLEKIRPEMRVQAERQNSQRTAQIKMIQAQLRELEAAPITESAT